MNRNTPFWAAAAITLAAFAGGVSASSWNKKTTLDIKETLLVPGKELPPGKYVIKLLDSSSNRHIVQIFNGDESRLETTILAIPNSRLQPTGDTVLRFWESKAGVPPALRAWFYPGDNFGQEFAYPKEMAERISIAHDNAKVPWYEGAADEASLKSNPIHDAEAPAPKAPAAAPIPVAQERGPEPKQLDGQAAAGAQAAAEVRPAPSSSPERKEPDLVAQNRPPAATPAPPAPERADPPAELPQTNTQLWTAALTGLALIAAGGALRKLL